MSDTDLLTAEQAGEYLGRSPAALRTEVHRGGLVPDGHVPGKGHRMVIAFTRANLDAFQAKRQGNHDRDTDQPPRSLFHAARRLTGMGRIEAAKALGLPGPRQLYRWEYGEIEPPLAVVRAMVRVYGCTLEALIGVDEQSG